MGKVNVWIACITFLSIIKTFGLWVSQGAPVGIIVKM